MPIFGNKNFLANILAVVLEASDYYTEATQRSLRNGGAYGP
jgi:hypothetical protein